MRLATLLFAASQTLASTGYWPWNGVSKPAEQPHRIGRRASNEGYVHLSLRPNSDYSRYMVDVSIGTPPQKIAVAIDTASADFWVVASENSRCVEGQCWSGSYSSDDSTSYELIEESGFNISYISPGDFDAGDWAKDTLAFEDGAEISEQLLGVIFEGSDEIGYMGLAYSTDPSTDPLPWFGAAPTLLDSLVAQGIIGRRVYSLYLNDMQATSGSLLFGGLDTTKYTGDLVTLPSQPYGDGAIARWDVTLTSMSFTDESGSTTQLSPAGWTYAAILDSGAPYVAIDPEVFTRIALGFGAVKDDYGYIVPCNLKNMKGTLNYGLGGEDGIVIRVPMSQIFGKEQVYDDASFNDESGACWLNIDAMESNDSGFLGDSFLRSAYVVFDMDNQIAAIGEAVNDMTHTSNVVTMVAGETTIPGATRTGTAPAVSTWSGDYTPPPVMIAVTDENGVVQAGTPTFNLPVKAAATSGDAGSPENAATVAQPDQTFLSMVLLGLALSVVMFA